MGARTGNDSADGDLLHDPRLAGLPCLVKALASAGNVVLQAIRQVRLVGVSIPVSCLLQLLQTLLDTAVHEMSESSFGSFCDASVASFSQKHSPTRSPHPMMYMWASTTQARIVGHLSNPSLPGSRADIWIPQNPLRIMCARIRGALREECRVQTPVIHFMSPPRDNISGPVEGLKEADGATMTARRATTARILASWSILLPLSSK